VGPAGNDFIWRAESYLGSRSPCPVASPAKGHSAWGRLAMTLSGEQKVVSAQEVLAQLLPLPDNVPEVSGYHAFPLQQGLLCL